MKIVHNLKYKLRLETSHNIYKTFISFQYSIVYYEKDGDEVVQHRSQPDVVTLPDYEILQVRKF